MEKGGTAFGPFDFDRSGLVLLRDGEPVAIGGRALALLKALLEAGGAIVTKAELMDRAWPDVVVEEANLPVQVAALRKALGAAPDGSDWIETVPRIGYRLNLPGFEGSRSDPLPVVAVLPFSTGATALEDVAAELAEEVATALSRFHSFRVIALQTRAAPDRDALRLAQERGSHYAIEGSVRHEGKTLRIGMRLVDTNSGTHLWADVFHGSADAVFEAQDRITEAVAGVLEPKIRRAELGRPRSHRPDSDAYELHLRSLPLFAAGTDAANREAIALLERAVSIDPSYLVAAAKAAQSYEVRVTMLWPAIGADDRARSVALARTALISAGDDATVLATCGLTLMSMTRDYVGGLALIDQALASNPYNVAALYASGAGNLMGGDLALAQTSFREVMRLSPGHPNTYLRLAGLAQAALILGEFDEALSLATRALVTNPEYPATHWIAVAATAKLGRDHGAVLAACTAAAPDTTLSRLRATQHSRDPARTAVLIDGLTLAGLRER